MTNLEEIAPNLHREELQPDDLKIIAGLREWLVNATFVDTEATPLVYCKNLDEKKPKLLQMQLAKKLKNPRFILIRIAEESATASVSENSGFYVIPVRIKGSPSIKTVKTVERARKASNDSDKSDKSDRLYATHRVEISPYVDVLMIHENQSSGQDKKASSA